VLAIIRSCLRSSSFSAERASLRNRRHAVGIPRIFGAFDGLGNPYADFVAALAIIR